MKILTSTALALALSATLAAGSANAHHSGKKKSYAACGWYAISTCSTSYNAAQNGADNFGGYVINTSSSKYPNFRGGYFCSVRGAFSKNKARKIRNNMRYNGAKSAYIKNAC